VGGGLSSIWNCVSFSISIHLPRALHLHSFQLASSQMTESRPESISFDGGGGLREGVTIQHAFKSFYSHSTDSHSCFGMNPERTSSSFYAYSVVLGKSVIMNPLELNSLILSIS